MKIRAMVMMLSLVASGAVHASTDHARSDGREPVVDTDRGPVIGVVDGGIQTFKGIPYAQAPVGELRWLPPQPHARWDTPLHADHFSATCATGYTLGGFGKLSSSEDCLYLNVFVPRGHAARGRLPVMVWIHGGGLGTGSGNDYSPHPVVDHGVILVTFNYRLGTFGYFSHPAINREHHPGVNYGTLDQQAVLKWVQRNIWRFGGDNRNVTIFGESAGGHSVLAQMVSPAAKGLFQRAIVESGAYGLRQPSLKEANVWGRKIASDLGCGDGEDDSVASCLRKASTEAILQHGTNRLPIAQVYVDGTIIPSDFIDAFQAGRFLRVPVINGYNENEGAFFAGLAELQRKRPIAERDTREALVGSFGPRIGASLYNIANFPPGATDVTQKYASFFGRSKFICSSILTSAILSRYVPVYAYDFADESAPPLLDQASIPYGAAHTSELQYLFSGFHGDSGHQTPLNARQRQLADRMTSNWTTFARSGSPNASGADRWKRFDETNEETLRYTANGATAIRAASTHFRCDDVAKALVLPRL
ncbi:Para-nitrobenzyl esterase [Pandoraea captiosa]|uniref:Carboxylic ester hydrolase n=1 Tax=Pandoraea captiosa TaxID=2508302 RepID=A0A5E4ZWK1_9BURK|nr:carboxylesterase family protein [Pandoraea captiosa]VVE64673.1 Para-nitrobenzyl esterase [Pandoraea captiosa]